MRILGFTAAFFLSACTSGGSDIGPEIADLPSATFKVLVRNDQDRGVSNAVVSVSGSLSTEPTGRNGRADLPIVVGGTRIITVDAGEASASVGDQLASLSVAAVFSGERELPYALFLPDLSPSAGLAVTSGVQGSPLTLDDSANSGAILAIASGTVLGLGAASSGSLQTGSLASELLPGRLPLPVAGNYLTGRGVFIGPVEVSFAPGASLSLPNDLNFGAGALLDLFHLDPVTGIWSIAGAGIVDAGATRVETGLGVIVEGGLYCFANDQIIATVISGRVLDRDGLALPGVLVQTGQASTLTAVDGRFTLPPVASEDGQGLVRNADILLHGGRDFLPSSLTVNRALGGPSLDLGDVTLDSKRITQVRALVIFRGRPEVRRRFRVSGYDSLSAATGLLSDSGLITIRDLEFGRFGLALARVHPGAERTVLSIELLNLERKLRRSIDLNLFIDQERWIPRSGPGTRVLDRDGSGEILGADIFSLRPGDDRFLLKVDEFRDKRLVFASDAFATASFSSMADNRRVISAFSAFGVNFNRVELPLERANRSALGVFDSHALISSTLFGRGGGNTIVLTPARSMIFADWYDEVFAGKSLRGQYPVKLDPGIGGGADLVLGVATPTGGLAVAEGDMVAGVLTLQRVWLAPDLTPVVGAVTAVDLGAPHDVSASHAVVGAVTGLDPTLAVSDLSFDYGVEFSDRRVLDVARGIAGNVSVAGMDADFTLPALSGDLAGGRHLLAWGGSTASAGTTIEQAQLLLITASMQSSAGFLAVPTITTPVSGSMVAATGFTVQFNVPPGSLYSMIQLRSETATEIRDWTVMVPDTVSSFDFRNLPQGADPLAPGSFTLKVTSVRVDPNGPLASFPIASTYHAVVARFLSLGISGMGVEAISSASIAVTLN